MQKNQKIDFIEFLISSGALRFAEDGKYYRLKNGRDSPYFLNIGEVNGKDLSRLGDFYYKALKEGLSGEEIEDSEKEIENSNRCLLIYGIPEKGIPIALSLSMKSGVPFFYTRKVTKEYGEATLSKENVGKNVIGKLPRDGYKIILVDDVITSGATKQEAYETLDSLGRFEYPLLLIALDRQEVGIDGKDAKKSFEEIRNTKVVAIANASDLCEYLKRNGYEKYAKRIANYLRVYGNKEAKNNAKKSIVEIEGSSYERIIPQKRSIIPACDFETIEEFENLVRETHELEVIGGYKIGSSLAIRYGLERLVDLAKKYAEKPIIYDHQKAGGDIPETSGKFMRNCKKAGVDAVIIFPLGGPETERALMYHAFENEIAPIVGSMMTHRGFTTKEKGFVDENRILDAYIIAAEAGVNNFVVPSNNPAFVTKLTRELLVEDVIPIYYPTGIGAQGGDIQELMNILYPEYYPSLEHPIDLHFIVGRSLYESKDRRNAAKQLEKMLATAEKIE